MNERMKFTEPPEGYERRSHIVIEGETYFHASVLLAAEADRDKMHERIMAMHRACDKAEADRDRYDDEAERKGLLAAEWKARHDEVKADRDRLQARYDAAAQDAAYFRKGYVRYRNALEQIRVEAAYPTEGEDSIIASIRAIARAAQTAPDTPPDA